MTEAGAYQLRRLLFCYLLWTLWDLNAIIICRNAIKIQKIIAMRKYYADRNRI